MRAIFTRCQSEAGFTLMSVTLVLLLLTTLGVASTLYTVLDLRATNHYNTGNRAFDAAEAGLLRALNTINTTGVINFQQDIANRWSTLFGSGAQTLPGQPTMSYQVIVGVDTTDPARKGSLAVTGRAPLSARRSLVATLARGGYNGAPGAIYLAADAGVATEFSGNAFEVDGNDHNILGQLVPTGPVKPGISTRNETVNNAVTGSLNASQKDNVQGLGFTLSPLTPSVLPSGGPSVDDLEQIINHLMSIPGATYQTINDHNINGNQTFGEVSSPQVTRLTDDDVRVNGNAQGAGILIVDGSITINGTLDFIGWIIVRGSTTINPSVDDETTVLGNATILGSLWTGDLDVKVGGSAIVDYCDTCLQMVDNMNSSNGGALPQPMQVTSWGEVL